MPVLRNALAAADPASDGAHLAGAVETAAQVANEAENSTNVAESVLRNARQREADHRLTYDEARRGAERLQTEVRTLTKLLKVAAGDLWPPLVDAIKVKSGYETALGAALGDDLEAPADEGEPVLEPV